MSEYRSNYVNFRQLLIFEQAITIIGDRVCKCWLSFFSQNRKLRYEMGAQKSTLNVRPRLSSQPMPPIVRDLHLAVMQNDLHKLKSVIASGVDVNYPWVNPEQPSIKDGCTALCEAISLNHVEAVEALINASACSTFIGSRDWQILYKAVYHGRDAIVKLLFAAGVDVHSRDEDGNTPLHICAKNSFVHNNSRCIVTLLECGSAADFQPNAKNRKGLTPLHLAAVWGMAEVAEILLDWKSYVDSVDNDYITPFYFTVSQLIRRRQTSSLSREIFLRQLAVIKLLLRHGCDSLGFATWFRNVLKISHDSEFRYWLEAKTPDDLKHLCRVYIQNLLGFTSIRHNYCVRKIRMLDVPECLKEYLCRRIIND